MRSTRILCATVLHSVAKRILGLLSGVVSAEEVDRQLEFMRNAPAEVKQMSERNSHALVGTLTVMTWADKEQCDLYGEGIQLAG